MAYAVRFSIPKRVLGRKDIEFEVEKDGSSFGTLKVSKGAIVWVPRGAGKGYKLGWAKFDGIMKERVKRQWPG